MAQCFCLLPKSEKEIKHSKRTLSDSIYMILTFLRTKKVLFAITFLHFRAIDQQSLAGLAKTRSQNANLKPILCNCITGGFSAKFRVGVCRPQFKMGPLARPIVVKMIPLARLISQSKVP